MVVVLTLVPNKNIHKRNNIKTQYKQYKTLQVRILPKHPHIHTPTHYKTHTYPHPHITKQVKTTTVKIYTPIKTVTIQSSTLSIRSP